MTMTRTLVNPPPQEVRGPFRRMLRKPALIASALVFAVIVIACLCAPILSPADPNQNDLAHVLAGPSGTHPLGTDQLGRDLFSRILFGGIPSLGYAGIVLVVALGIGIPLGTVAGYVGGRTDRILATAADIGLAIPVLVMSVVVLSVFNDFFWVAMVLLGVLMCPPVIRNVRGAVIGVRRENFVDAARVAGLSPFSIMRTHVLPRIVGPLLVQATLVAGLAIGFTVGLSFLGFGPQPPDPTWGGMIRDAAQSMTRSSWPMVVVGSVLAITVLSLMVLGDTIREAAVDPWARTSPRAKQSAPNDPIVPGEALVDVRDLRVTYTSALREVDAVDGVSFSISAGESVGIVGESGCGKSTVARAIARVLPAAGRVSTGSIRFQDQSVIELSGKDLNGYRGASVGYVFQDPMSTLEPSMRVGDLLTEVVQLHRRIGRRAARAHAIELLERVQISDAEVIARRFPHELSGGLAQRVAIARAIAGEPKLLIADEPTTALDASIRLQILELLRSLQRDTGMALLVVSHDWDVVTHLCDRAIVMYGGQISEIDELPELTLHSAHPYTQALLACRPAAGADRSEPLPVIPGQVPAPGTWGLGCRFADRCAVSRDICHTAPVPLIDVEEGHTSRCLFADEVRMDSITKKVGA